jgi:hypothetical protein
MKFFKAGEQVMIGLRYDQMRKLAAHHSLPVESSRQLPRTALE